MELTLNISKYILLTLIVIVLYRIIRQRRMYNQLAPKTNTINTSKILGMAEAKRRAKLRRGDPAPSPIINIPKVTIQDVID